MSGNADTILRQRLVSHIKGGEAFLPIDNLIEKVPYHLTGVKPDALPYSFFQLFYHIRMAQLDILKYCSSGNYREPVWPDDYWPANTAPDNEQEWMELISNYLNEREEFCELLLDESNHLFQPIASNPDHNLMRQAQLIIEHSAYHTGQLYVIYRLFNK